MSKSRANYFFLFFVWFEYNIRAYVVMPVGIWAYGDAPIHRRVDDEANLQVFVWF